MKKILSLALALVMALALCACGSAGEGGAGETETTAASTGAYQVGYGRSNITPDYSVPLAGYGNTSMRMSTSFQTYLYSNCVAISDGENTLLLFNNDLTALGNGHADNIREAITAKLGIPREFIFVAATHNHSAPDLGNSAEPNIAKYNTQLIEWHVEAAKAALEDLKPCTGMFYGSTNPEGLNFIRHYVLEDGTYKGDNFGDLNPSPYAGHTHDVDNQLQVVKFAREGGKDVILVNWQTHPHRGGGGSNTIITADLAGIMVTELEEKADAHVAYFTGAAGNVNPSSRIAEENITPDYWVQGETLASHANGVLNGEMTELAMGKIQAISTKYTGETDHSEDHLVNYALEVQALWTKNNNFIEAVTLANSYGINSPYHAGAIVSKAGNPNTYTMEIYAASFGDFGIAGAPFEMFDENGKYIKENSPFAQTFVLELCNGSNGYIPSEEGYRIRCYEANTGKFAPGAGELVAEEYVKLLESIYATK